MYVENAPLDCSANVVSLTVVVPKLAKYGEDDAVEEICRRF